MASAEKTSLMRPERHCPVCGEPFRPHRNQRFCSSRCRRASWSATNPLGLTLRQWYAGMAMQGELAAQSKDSGYYLESNYSKLAKNSFLIADAMIQHERDSK